MNEIQDYSTIVSIVPVPISEFKPGLYPGQFNIKACEDPDKPVIFHVKGSKQMLTVAGQKNPVAIETPSFTLAQAIVRDYNSSIIAREGESGAGLDFVQGKHSLEQVLTNNPELLPNLKRVQKLWYVALVKMADNDWARYHNHKAISDIAKIAARSLKLDREWLLDNYSADAVIRCIACKQNIDKSQLVCHLCRAIQDNKKVEAAGIKFAA